MKLTKKVLAMFMAVAALSAFSPMMAFAEDTTSEDSGSTSLTDSAKSDDVVILYTNDVHCAVDNNIGYDGLALYKYEMQTQYSYVVTVDAGDAIQGAPIGSLSQGKDIITLMNAVGYDVCIPGNHEFDYGMDTFMERSRELECGYVSCNFKNLETNQTVFDPYKIVEAGDKKIAFVGVTTPETFFTSTPAYFQNDAGEFNYSFSEQDNQLWQTVQDSVDAAKKENADYVILVGHLGEHSVTPKWSVQEVIAHTTGIDAVIDGHSHDETPSTSFTAADGKDVLITQTGTKLKHIGKMTISADGTLTSELVDVVPAPENLPADSWKAPEDRKGKFVDTRTYELIGEINEAQDAILDQKIGETPFTLYNCDPETGVRRVRNGETNIGNMYADAYREVTGADVAFINGGGLRASIEAGDITYREAMSVQPFGNMVCSARVTGQQILDMLEFGVRMYPEESGGFPSVSGMTFAFDPDVESTVQVNEKGEFEKVAGKRRVHSVKIGDEPLDPEKTYVLASHNYYLKNSGDGYGPILNGKCEIVRDDMMSDTELSAYYIRDMLDGKVPERYRDPYGEGRMRLEKAPETQDTTEPTDVPDYATLEGFAKMAKIDYEKKYGIAVTPEAVLNADNIVTITLKDASGAVLDTYTLDSKTGIGKDAQNTEVNLPQTGVTSMTDAAAVGGALTMIVAGFWMLRGVCSRKKDAE